ncbi:MAG: hypothetical protein LBR58_03035 [Propionibacteriaceae bacterium]|nr:hypothetical protein [Propionibacteriaceae bacterium]
MPGIPNAATADEPADIALDVHLGYKPQKECTSSRKPGTEALLRVLKKNFGGTDMGISRSCGAGGTSEHKEGRALDWGRNVKYASHRTAVNKAIKWLTANNGEVAYRLGVMYIIWNQQIWSIYYPEMGWRKMADRGSYTQNHKDHVHISLSYDGAMMRTSWWTGVPVTDPCTSMKGCSKPSSVPYASSNSLTRPFLEKVAAVPFVPFPGKDPEMSGSPIVGHTLGTVIGDWSPANEPGAEIHYQWYRGSTKVGTDSPTYTVQPADVGKCIDVAIIVMIDSEVKKTLKAGETTYVMKNWVTSAPGVAAFPAQTLVGDVLSAAHDDWEPAEITVKTQWLRDGKAISGATSDTYTTTAADYGKKISVKLTGSASGYTTKTVTSGSTQVVKEFATVGAVTVTGVNMVAGKLTAKNSGWSPKPSSYSYQWLRDGEPIAKATKSTYTLTDADEGALVTVQVTAKKSKYLSTAVTSADGEPVAQGITITQPVISGTLKVGQTLTAEPGEWGPEGVVLTYRWYRNGKSISKATKLTYKLTKSDKGKKITFKVTAKLSGYPSRTSTSAASAKVK